MNNVQCLLYAVSAAGDRTGFTHSVQKFLLIRARLLAWKFYFDVDSPSVPDAVTPNIGLAMVTDIDDTAVFRKELTYGVVPRNAAVLTEGYDNLVLEYGFGVNNDRLPGCGWRSSRSGLNSMDNDGCVLIVRKRSNGVVFNELDCFFPTDRPGDSQPNDHLFIIVDGPVVLRYADQSVVEAGVIENNNVLISLVCQSFCCAHRITPRFLITTYPRTPIGCTTALVSACPRIA